MGAPSVDLAQVYPRSTCGRGDGAEPSLGRRADPRREGRQVVRPLLHVERAIAGPRPQPALLVRAQPHPQDDVRDLRPGAGQPRLLDVGRQLASGRPDPLAPGFEITGAHLEQTAKAQGVEVRRGDSLMIRTGWGQYFGKDNGKYLGEQSPGPGQDGARWIIDRGVRLAGDDTATFEKRPAAYGKELFSVHMMLLADSGIYIVENANLEPLADAKAYVALLILTPLRIQGASGSPLRAIALAP